MTKVLQLLTLGLTTINEVNATETALAGQAGATKKAKVLAAVAAVAQTILPATLGPAAAIALNTAIALTIDAYTSMANIIGLFKHSTLPAPPPAP